MGAAWAQATAPVKKTFLEIQQEERRLMALKAKQQQQQQQQQEVGPGDLGSPAGAKCQARPNPCVALRRNSST
jgi:hypothetical protein